MKGVIGDVFGAVLEHLIAGGHVKLEHYFLDGTKIEADANKHKVMWVKRRETYHQRVQAQINDEEQEEYGDDDLEFAGSNPGPATVRKLKIARRSEIRSLAVFAVGVSKQLTTR